MRLLVDWSVKTSIDSDNEGHGGAAPLPYPCRPPRSIPSAHEDPHARVSRPPVDHPSRSGPASMTLQGQVEGIPPHRTAGTILIPVSATSPP